MNSILKKISTIGFAFALLFSLSLTAFAADDELKINSDAVVKVGDTVKYSIYLSETKETLVGFQMSVFFDNEYLELVPDSLTHEKFNGSFVANTSKPGRLLFNWTDIGSTLDFSKKSVFVTAEFKVLKAGQTEISQFVSDMYTMKGEDLPELTSYKWTYSVSVNDKTIVEDKTPIINTDEETLSKYQGGFINYVDGMGEDNSPNKDNHEFVTGVVETQVVTNLVENTRYETVKTNSSDKGLSMSNLILIIAAVVIVGAMVAVVIVKKTSEKKKGE